MPLSLFTALGALRSTLPEQSMQVVPARWAPASPASPSSTKRAWACNQAPPCKGEQSCVRNEPIPYRQVRQFDPAGLPTQRSQCAHLNDATCIFPVIRKPGLGHLPSPKCRTGPARFEELPRPDGSGFRIDQNVNSVRERETARLMPPPIQAVVNARLDTEECHERGRRPEKGLAAMRHRVFTGLLERHLVRADRERHTKREHAPSDQPKHGKPSGSSDEVAPLHRHPVYQPQR